MSDNELLNPLNSKDVILTDEQKSLILSCWNTATGVPPSIAEICFKVFNRKVTGRSKESLAVKDYIATRTMKPKVSNVENAINIIEERAVNDDKLKAYNKIELTEEQKLFIENNCDTLGPIDLAKNIFNNNGLTGVDKETLTVINHLKTLHHKTFYEDPDKTATRNYNPPASPERTIRIINKYVREGIVVSKMTSRQKKDVEAVMNYLHSLRFINQINSYETVAEREFFESEFVRCTWDKCDLTEEEVDQYIAYAADVLTSTDLERRIRRIGGEADDLMTGDREADDRRLGMSMVEALKDLRSDYNACLKRQNTLLETLKGKRSERIEKQEKGGASILTFVELWKFEDSRKKIIDIANKKNEKLKEGFEELNAMDDLKAKILGIDFITVKNG